MNDQSGTSVMTVEEETVQPAVPVDMASSLAVGLSRVEIDQQIATAHKFPRSISRAVGAIVELATLDEDTAEECIYSLPRSGKTIDGASIRLAEIISQSWGNCRVASRVVHVDRDEKYVEAEGVYHDLETNMATLARVRRRISNARGIIYSDDMILQTGNAAASIAKRNAILSGVPKGVWWKAYQAAREVVTGDATTLSSRRSKLLEVFQHFGATPEMVFAALKVKGEEDISLNNIATLRGMYSALKNGEATIEEMFGSKAISKPKTTAKAELDSFSGDETSTENKPADEGSPASDETVSPVDKYRENALKKIDTFSEPNPLDLWWRDQQGEREKLGIIEDTPHFKTIQGAVSNRISKLLNEPADDTFPGDRK